MPLNHNAILSSAEVDRIEAQSAWFGDVGLLAKSHRAQSEVIKDLVNNRCWEMMLRQRLEELLARDKPHADCTRSG